MASARNAVPLITAVLAVALLAPAARAVDPSVTVLTEQCDGSFTAGTATRKPNAGIRAQLQSDTGLKLGQRRLSIRTGVTRGLWRFDGNYTVTVSSCYTGGCNGGADSCRTWRWVYDDANGSADLETGQCTYRDTIGGSCANTMSLYGSANHAPVQVLTSCPASTTTLGGAGSVAISATGPLSGTAANGLSAEALSLANSRYATASDSANWDLPATYTLSAWIRTSATGGRIVSQQNGAKYWGIGVGGSGRLRHFDSRDSSPDVEIGAGPLLTDNAWHLVHLVRSNGVARRYYVDGKLVGTTAATSTTSFAGNPILGTLEIGRFSGGSEFFTGTIDDVRILATELTDDDIFLEWNTTIHKISNDSGVVFSTVSGSYSGSPSNGTTGAVTYIPGEGYSSTRRWMFMAANVNGDATLSGAAVPSIDNSPPVAPTLNGAPAGATSVLWSWGLPPKVCLPPGSSSVDYRLIDAPSGSVMTPPGIMSYPTASVTETLGGSPNQLVGRRLRVDDVWGNGVSASATVYTLANPPGTVSFTAVSTGSAAIVWSQNGNPSYTRWGVNFSPDPAFGTAVSTFASMATNHTGSSIPISGLQPGTTYYGRVQSFSGRAQDSFGGSTSTFLTASMVTLPTAPALAGATRGVSSITWNWSQRTGAQEYKLFLIDGTTLTPASYRALTLDHTGLAVNTQYVTQVEAVSPSGAGARTTAAAYTLANDPALPAPSLVHASSAVFVWGGNGNPSYTFYELVVSTDSAFATVTATVTVNATTGTVTGLLPGTTYHARVRSINGGQIPGNFVAIASTRTLADPLITTSSSPSSPYAAEAGIVGQWSFDEGSGLSVADGSGKGNAALLTCVSAGCSSTPTFAAGPDGLGSAVAFTGLDHGLVRVPDTSTYNFTDGLTVAAWARPDTTAQPDGAGIVVRGSGTAVNFALDVAGGGLWRFTPKNGFNAVSSFTLTPGAWTHLIGSYDASAGTATLYLNGVPYATVTGVGARTAQDHDITIGNRQSATGASPYNRGFIGRIDGVRVFRKTFTPAQALAEYRGNFVSTVTPASPNDRVAIGLPPNAFGAPATIFVSNDPVNSPIRIDAATLNAGLAVAPTGHALIPGSLFEIVPVVSGLPFTANLGSSATVSLPYNDANGDSIVDGTSPPLAAANIKAYTLNTTVNRWEELPSVHDRANRRVVAWTPHFSVFALFGPYSIGTSLSELRAYPNPWKPRSGGRFDGTGVTFDRLPASGTIRILTQAGERVRELSFSGASAGTVIWDGRNDAGRAAASGVYFARITGEGGSTRVVKFAIER
jgi:hypothetical protein